MFGRPREAQTHEMTVLGGSVLPWNRYLLALNLVRLAGGAAESERGALLAEADGLIEAECARIEGRALDAMAAYDLAYDLAHAHGADGDAALALELAARFHRAAGRARVAGAYAAAARDAFHEWGAAAKVEQLEAELPELVGARGAGRSERAGSKASEALDIATITKASEAIASELHLDRLRALEEHNRSEQEAGRPSLRMGIGVTTGELLVGASGATTLYQVLDVEPPAHRDALAAALEDHLTAWRLYHDRRLAEALPLIERCAAALPGERVCALFLERCRGHLDRGISEDWDGVEVLREK